MKYYISCAADDHGRIKKIGETLIVKGHTSVYDRLSDGKGKESFELAFDRVQAIENSELFLCLLPFTHTTSVEFGTALASRCGKRIILWSDKPDFFEAEYANTYSMHPSVTRLVCPFNELLTKLSEI